MTNGSNGRIDWRAVALFLAGVVISMTAFYAIEFRRTLTRDEAIQLVEQMRPGPPWVQDRTHVMQRLEADQRMIAELLREMATKCKP